jgi:hypothetical protein
VASAASVTALVATKKFFFVGNWVSGFATFCRLASQDGIECIDLEEKKDLSPHKVSPIL